MLKRGMPRGEELSRLGGGQPAPPRPPSPSDFAPEGLKAFGSSNDLLSFDRVRVSGGISQCMLPRRSPPGSAVDEQKSEIQRSFSSEADIKELAITYLFMLNEKERELHKLPKENNILKKSLKASTIVAHVTEVEDPETIKKTLHVQNVEKNDDETENKGRWEGNENTLDSTQSIHQTEVKRLRGQLDKEREVSAKMKLKLQEESKLNESSLKGLHYLKMEKEKEKEKMENLVHQLKKTLTDTSDERDKVQTELARLKQHLLDKELERSAKMEMENKIIHELLANSEYLKGRIAELEKALWVETTKLEEMHRVKNEEVYQLNEVINSLSNKLEESSADGKTRENELALSREESTKLSELLKVANEELDKCRQKLEEENWKLQHEHTVEESKMSLTPMTIDSNYFVDRIVIKLLVTYFQRNHCKEVLDVMVQMLGFSEDDKRKMGYAREAAGKMVGGVLSFPGRLVGSVFGGSYSDSSPEEEEEHSLYQCSADLSVEFLLKDGPQGVYEGESDLRLRKPPQPSSSSTTPVKNILCY